MNSLAFVTHPSVRIKGTENNYTPSMCLDERCPIKAPHMHCPFCVKTDAYQDPVILKAHYRVKHVDKGIEFAGLRILRCCDHCDIIGIIKGEKRFKGAHWHCYRCRNGFNRRDEAIKHYKTHFRNPQTTFQIQITQDLNSPSSIKSSNDQHDEPINTHSFSECSENPIQEMIHPVLSQAPLSENKSSLISSHSMGTEGSLTLTNSKYKKAKVKDEPLLLGDDPHAIDEGQTIMIIQGDHLESTFANHILHSGAEVSVLDKTDSTLSWEIRCRMEEEEKNEYKARVEEYKNRVGLLEQRIQELESHQSSQLRVTDLLASLSLGNEERQLLAQQISKYLEEIELQGSQERSLEQVDSGTILHHLDPSEQASGLLSPDAQRTSLTQELQSVSVVGHLSSMSEPSYQVIASSQSENHNMIMSNAGVDNHIQNSVNRDMMVDMGNGRKSREGTNTVSSASAEGMECQVFTQSTTSINQGQELIVMPSSSDVVQSDQIPQNFLVSASPQTGNTVIEMDGSNADNDRLLQMVAVSAGQGGEGTDTFIMETESGERIIIQPSGDSANQISSCQMEPPESKRQRIS